MEIPQHLPWELTGETLGSGGQGNVYLVTNREKNDGTKYALKLLRNPASLQARKRFCREIEAIQDLDHCSIIKVYDHSEENENFQYFVMEYHHEACPLDSIISSKIHQSIPRKCVVKSRSVRANHCGSWRL